MPRRSIPMLLTAREKANGWKAAKRRCRQCSASFQPVREKQRFCPGGVCRVAYWSEHQATEVHRCRCGRACSGPNPNRCRRPDCEGTLVQDGDGGAVCLFCARPAEVLEELLASADKPRLRGAVRP